VAFSQIVSHLEDEIDVDIKLAGSGTVSVSRLSTEAQHTSQLVPWATSQQITQISWDWGKTQTVDIVKRNIR
jgi:hypothetical protein